ncbi:MAG: hypothetical protein HRT88_04215 [Lentisphaeraceae bacterium]|nr:hypothetical protein [Lentisphaeraceae bacterium]
METYFHHHRYKGDSRKEFIFVHLMSRVIQPTYFGCQYPFSRDDKFYMVNLLKRLDKLFCFDLLSYCIMDNHFHVVIRIAKDAEQKLKRCEVKSRYEQFYFGKNHMDARSEACHTLRSKLNDFSHFMWLFLRMTSYRHNRKSDRRGPLWRDRFKSVVIESASALSTILKYVELNPVRAKLVKNPADYAWSSWGEKHTGKFHPYRQRIIKSLRWAHGFDNRYSDAEIFAKLGADLASLATFEFNDDAELIALVSEKMYKLLLQSNPAFTNVHRIAVSFDEEFKT